VAKGSWKSVNREEWQGRLTKARRFFQSAEKSALGSATDDDAEGIMSNALLAAIAFADALTIKIGGIQNIQDHRSIVTTIKTALGARAHPAQMNRLGRLVSRKDEIQYDHRQLRLAEATEFLDQVKRFADWVVEELGNG
jgi:hypothetical protein